MACKWGGIGKTHPRSSPSPHPSSDSLLGGSTHFFPQETEAHGEEEVGRGRYRRGREVA